MDTIGFIGAGNMAEALIKGIINAGVCKPKYIFISDVRSDRLELITRQYGVRAIVNSAALAGQVDILVLSVKPQNMADVLLTIESTIRYSTLTISIAAGVRIAEIAAALGDKPIIRVMPNTPALIGEGASALFANSRARPMMEKAMRIFSAVGKTVIVDNEELIDAVTAVSGSGPAYFFALMEEMIKAGHEMGLPPEIVKILALQTAKGAALLALERDKFGESPSELRRKVTSPGGTTEAALKVFTARQFGQIINQALRAARDKSRELSS
ncbi:MAG: pyrroline-5-carboxylate reductase [Sedimentisphaerales bacterium]|nr:pyrroline-5-carboxylate reductase [Sedimentisphaerales bacterium]